LGFLFSLLEREEYFEVKIEIQLETELPKERFLTT